MGRTYPAARAKRRQAIIEVAAQLFAVGGYAGTSMERVAEVAGITKATIYAYFASKEALFEAVLTQWEGQLPHFETGIPASRKLEAVIDSILEIALHPAMCSIRQSLCGPDSEWREWRRRPLPQLDACQHALETCLIDEGFSPADGTSTANLLVNFMLGLSATWNDEPPVTHDQKIILKSILLLACNKSLNR